MLNPNIFAKRRAEFMGMLGDGVAILPTARQQTRNSDVFFPFRADSDFYYLTQFPEPEAVAVFIPERAEGQYILFCRASDAVRESWDGRRAGVAGAIEKYGADQAFPIEQLPERLPKLLGPRAKIFTMMGRYPDFDSDLSATIDALQNARRGRANPVKYVDLRAILHEMRLFKQHDELQVMRKAARLSAAGHMRAMQYTRPGRYEYQVQAELECEFRQGGSEFPAYPSIVAGGGNACVLHYTENCAELQDGDLLLIDAGAELACYAADITRTFPVNGRFSAPQRALYEIVLAAQQAAIAAVQPERSVVDYHNAAVEVLAAGLLDLGLLQGDLAQCIANGDYTQFYMHRTGHWLGMDVHDVGDYKVDGEWRVLEAGMVLTVEPGLYIPATAPVAPEWQNIGIRIEDDVLVTRQGCEVISRHVPKEIAEIEALMADAG